VTVTENDTRVLWSVESPASTMSVGLFYEDTAYSGLSVDTTEHVRLYAKGDKGESDAIAQATGQVWMQAMGNLALVAKNKVMVSALATTAMAAKKGITVMAGLSGADAKSEGTPGTMPSSVSSYEDKAKIAAGVWAGFDVAMIATTAAAAIVEAITKGKMTWLGATGVAANVAGTAVNIAALTGKKEVAVPGIHLFSEGGTFIGGAYGSVNMAGLPGALLGSLFTHQFALFTTSVRGVFRASLTAVGPIDISSLLWYEGKTDGDHTVASRIGTMSVRGVSMKIGQVEADLPQLPTLSIELSALRQISLRALRTMTLSAGKSIKSKATVDTEIKASTELSMSVGAWEIAIDATSAKLGPSSGPHIAISPTGVLILSPARTGQLKLENGKISAMSLAGTMDIKPGLSLAVNGTEMKIQ
jgi:hypothetical protein